MRSPFREDLELPDGTGKPLEKISGLVSSPELAEMDSWAFPAVTEDGPHSPPWLWLRDTLEMTPNANETHLHDESIYQQLKCWNTWTWLSAFPRNFHRNLNTPNHPQWQMNSAMAWEMSKILNWILNKWSTWQKQDMNLDSNNFGLSPMSSWIYICVHIYYIYISLYLSLEMQLCSWFLKS